ncbi:unnamed protein product [Ectocarpus sp. 12 AP-2014]
MTKTSNGKGKALAIATPLKTRVASVEEIWKPTHVTPLYEVSNFGRVRRTDTRFVRCKAINRQGYQLLTLPIGGKSYTNLVGRLVLGAFERAPLDGDVAHHIDRNRANDVLENLKWTSICEASTIRSYPLTIASRPVIATSVPGEEICVFVSALEASSLVNTRRAAIYDAIRHGQPLEGYTFEYDASDDPTCEIREVRGRSSYSVSSDGRVRMASGRWTYGSRHHVKAKAHGKEDRSYRRVVLTVFNDGVKAEKKEYVHLLVAEAFIGERREGYQVDHIDGNESNNDVSNLEYVTASENNKRAYASGKRKPPGEKPVLLVKRDGTYRRFQSSSDGSRKMGVSVATVSTNCKKGRANKDGEFWVHDKPVMKPGPGDTFGERFDSLTDASVGTGEDVLSILRSCRNKDDESWVFLE